MQSLFNPDVRISNVIILIRIMNVILHSVFPEYDETGVIIKRRYIIPDCIIIIPLI